MRIPRYVALLCVAVSAFAADTPSDSPPLKLQPQMEWKSPFRGPDGRLQFRTLPDSIRRRSRLPETIQPFGPGGNTCYFIRSYAVRRVDGTDETVPAGVTTCTPSSRFQLRRSTPRK